MKQYNSKYKHFNFIRQVLLFYIFFIILVYPMVTHAEKPGLTNQYRVVDGLIIYLGVIPAEIITGPAAKDMHGGIPTGSFRYHVSIAVFNSETKKRVINIKLKVKFSNFAGETEFIELEPMNFNGQIVFGNYFSPEIPGPYRIQVMAQPPDKKSPVITEFQYQIGHASR